MTCIMLSYCFLKKTNNLKIISTFCVKRFIFSILINAFNMPFILIMKICFKCLWCRKLVVPGYACKCTNTMQLIHLYILYIRRYLKSNKDLILFNLYKRLKRNLTHLNCYYLVSLVTCLSHLDWPERPHQLCLHHLTGWDLNGQPLWEIDSVLGQTIGWSHKITLSALCVKLKEIFIIISMPIIF